MLVFAADNIVLYDPVLTAPIDIVCCEVTGEVVNPVTGKLNVILQTAVEAFNPFTLISVMIEPA